MVTHNLQLSNQKLGKLLEKSQHKIKKNGQNFDPNDSLLLPSISGLNMMEPLSNDSFMRTENEKNLLNSLMKQHNSGNELELSAFTSNPGRYSNMNSGEGKSSQTMKKNRLFLGGRCYSMSNQFAVPQKQIRDPKKESGLTSTSNSVFKQRQNEVLKKSLVILKQLEPNGPRMNE